MADFLRGMATLKAAHCLAPPDLDPWRRNLRRAPAKCCQTRGSRGWFNAVSATTLPCSSVSCSSGLAIRRAALSSLRFQLADALSIQACLERVSPLLWHQVISLGSDEAGRCQKLVGGTARHRISARASAQQPCLLRIALLVLGGFETSA